MSASPSLAPAVLLTGLALGVAGDALLRAGPWALNVVVWLVLVLASATLLARRAGGPWPRTTLLPAALALLAACGMAWRDAVLLRLADLAVVTGAMLLVLWQARGVPVWQGGLVEQGGRLVLGGLVSGLGYLPLFLGVSPWPAGLAPGSSSRVRALGLGALLALPLLGVFGALLVSADAVFAELVRRLVDIDFQELMSHVVPATVCAWFTGGWLVGLLFRDRLPAPPLRIPQWVTLGRGEVAVALGLVNLLFLAFVAVQVRYLFGGADLVALTPGLTYAEYARRGFFELVAVAALAVPVLLAADWTLGDADRRGFRVQAAGMVLLLGVILASAFHRMRLYTEVFGWTGPRFYVVVFMFWLVLLFAWLVATVLRGHRRAFVPGGMVAGLAFLAALHVLNPDGWIVRQNLARAGDGSVRAFDGRYAVNLSADAFPALLAAWDILPAADRDRLADRIRRWDAAVGDDWRLWSVSAAQARQAIRGAAVRTGLSLEP